MTVGLVWEYVTDLFTGAHTDGFSGISVGVEYLDGWFTAASGNEAGRLFGNSWYVAANEGPEGDEASHMYGLSLLDTHPYLIPTPWAPLS